MNPQIIENSALGFLSSLPMVDAAQVRKVVMMFAASFPPEAGIDLETYVEAIAKKIEEKLDLTMDDASAVMLPFQQWLPAKRASVDEYYWRRYRNYLQQGGFPPRILGTMDKDTDRITGLLEDPSKAGRWKRRGLVVGHVQSGKTANYIGVIAKAADHGYKFIVLLAGTQNNLRRQTQERLEEGFIGIDSDLGEGSGKPGAPSAWTGVGLLDRTRRPISITSKRNDFRTNIANSAGISFAAVREPIILIIKKQKRVLENLIAWLTTNNQATGGVIRDVPLLLIDDEADNASINTREDSDPTEINRLIRALLAKFDQNSYLGYTATPFANIFIDPDSQQEMVQEDLFPRDFIVSLDAPSDYAGASRIFNDQGDLAGMIREVEDHQELLPEKHRISHVMDELPVSLESAIRGFILARSIRILRGRGSDHNSMLVNVSRFNDVQDQVTALISDYLTRIRQAAFGHAALSIDRALGDPIIQALYQTWKDEFEAAHPSWPEIQSVLNEAAGPVTVKLINRRSTDLLDYKANKKNGLHVIAVGGLGLSRGFTLEGLTSSYFLRNSIMYDTLLQMGRWFGFRKGYEDLCRIYMTTDAVDWYSHISNALEELRDEFRRMERQNARPEDFGLKVRAHPDSLIVTARNKMRSGRTVRHSVSLDGELIETVAISDKDISWNWNQLEGFVSRLDAGSSETREEVNQGILWRSVPAASIKAFLETFRNEDDFSLGTQIQPVVKFIDLIGQRGTEDWDVCLYSPGHGEGRMFDVGLNRIRLAQRNCILDSGVFRISGNARRVASRGAEKVGLTLEEVERAQLEFEDTDKDVKNISDRYYRVQRSRPLLMLHVLDLLVDKVPVGRNALAWGISFPRTGIVEDLVQYVVNVTWWRDRFNQEQDDEEEVADA